MGSFISGTDRTALLNSSPVTDDVFDLIYVRVSSESVANGELELWVNDIDGASRPIQAEA